MTEGLEEMADVEEMAAGARVEEEVVMVELTEEVAMAEVVKAAVETAGALTEVVEKEEGVKELATSLRLHG